MWEGTHAGVFNWILYQVVCVCVCRQFSRRSYKIRIRPFYKRETLKLLGLGHRGIKTQSKIYSKHLTYFPALGFKIHLLKVNYPYAYIYLKGGVARQWVNFLWNFRYVGGNCGMKVC